MSNIERKLDEVYISPTVEYSDLWHEALADDDLRERFNSLVRLTQKSADSTAHPWVLDDNAVAARWQHLVVAVGDAGETISHPLFRSKDWSDAARVEQVLGQISTRDEAGSFIEKALILTHSLISSVPIIDVSGLSVSLDTSMTIKDSKDPSLGANLARTFDLRDMGEPTLTVLGDMTLEEFQSLNETQQAELGAQLSDLWSATHNYGNGYGWEGTPQQKRFRRERMRLQEYRNLTIYGTNVESEIQRIRHERKAAEIAQLRTERPDFGKEPDDWESLSERAKDCVHVLFDYFDEMRLPFELIDIDTYSLGQTLGFTDSDVQILRDSGVLVGGEPFLSPGGVLYSFKLAAPYYESWVSAHYPET